MLANSFTNCENTMDLWNVLAMFDSIGQDSKRQSLRFRDRLVASGAVRKYSGKIGHFANPATVAFPLDLNHEIAHSANPTTSLQTTRNPSAQRPAAQRRGPGDI